MNKLNNTHTKLHLNKRKIFNDFNLPTKNDHFTPNYSNILTKSVGKIRWQFLLASRFCQLPTDFWGNNKRNQYVNPLASKNILASLLANDFNELSQKIARWQGYILKYIWSEYLRLTPYTGVKK